MNREHETDSEFKALVHRYLARLLFGPKQRARSVTELPSIATFLHTPAGWFQHIDFHRPLYRHTLGESDV